MNEPEEFDEPLHDGLHQIVDHVYASPDLAQRVEEIARRRRAVRLSGVCAIALVALGTATGVLVSHQTPAVSATSTHLPNCAADRNSYKSGTPTKLGESNPGPVVPGTPAAAEVCRYAGFGQQPSDGGMAGSAKITAGRQLDQLLSTLNASQVDPSGEIYCPETNGAAAYIIFAYPGNTADFVVSFDPGCGVVSTPSAVYLERENLTQLITDWTGS